MSNKSIIKNILLSPGTGKEVYCSHSNDTLLLHPYRSIHSMTMHNTLHLISKIPDYAQKHSLVFSHIIFTNFDVILAVGYDPTVLKKAINKVLQAELIYRR